MIKLIFTNLTQRPTRTAVSILAVALGVALVLVSVGLSYGALNDSAERTRQMGDVMVQPSNASFLQVLNSGNFAVRIGTVLEKVDGVAAVTPVLSKFLAEAFHLIYGIDTESFLKVNEIFQILEGRMFEGAEEVVVDTNYAHAQKVGVGDQINILGTLYTVTGIFKEGIGARVLLPLVTLQEKNGTPDKCTMFFIRVRDDATIDEVYEELKVRPKGYKITKTAELQELLAANTPVFRQFITAVVTLSSVISFLMILLAMYTTITERTREIGILKSLGASKAYIIKLILQESLLICGLGVLVGYGLTFVTLQIVVATFPNLKVDISEAWRVGAALMAVGAGIFGALYPALKAAQLDPIKALGYE